MIAPFAYAGRAGYRERWDPISWTPGRFAGVFSLSQADSAADTSTTGFRHRKVGTKECAEDATSTQTNKLIAIACC